MIKYVVGLLSNSIAIISDAFNNLSDCVSFLVTLFGYKIAAKPADKEHPFGHGRMEYLTTLAIAVIIAMMGFELLQNAVSKLMHPEVVTFHITTLLILLVSIAVKLWMMYFNTVLGECVHSSVIMASAKDSRNDVIATAATILALVTSLVTDIPVDGIIGVIISLFILKSAFDMIRDMVSDLLGRPEDAEVVQKIRYLILSKPGIEGVHDMLIHNYGPGKMLGSCHVEVRSDADFVAAHSIVDVVECEIYDTMHILMTIHMDPIELNDEQINNYRKIVQQVLQELDQSLSFHDFRFVPGENEKHLVFDLVVPFSCPYTEEELKTSIDEKLQRIELGCSAIILFDQDYT